VLRCLLIAALLVPSLPAAASQRIAINATCAAAIADDTIHVTTLRDAIAQALVTLGTVPAGYSIDASLVRLDVVAKRDGELEVRVEIRAVLSDQRGRMRSISVAQSLARGRERDRALLQRDAITESARQVAKRLAAR